MAQLKDLLVEGQSRMVGYLYATSDIYEKGTALEDKYGATLSISGTSLSLKSKNGGSLSSVTLPDNNTTYTFANGTNGFTVTPSGGSAQTVTVTPSATITANATDGIFDITGTNGTNAVTYAVAPYSSQQSKRSFDTSSTAPTRTDRLNYNGYLYATKLYSGGSEVLTSVADASTTTKGILKVPTGTGLAISSGSLSLSFGSGLDVTTENVLVVSIDNNVTGSGTSGYIAKFNGTNTITNGPQFGSSTTTFLNNKGEWATPTGTTYSAGDAIDITSNIIGVKVGSGLGLSESNQLQANFGVLAGTVAEGNHTHTTTLAADSGTTQLSMVPGSKYKLTAGGTDFIFTLPAYSYYNAWYYPSALAKTALYRYQLCFRTKDNKILPANAVNDAPSNYSKTLTTESFDPFGIISYNGTTSTYSAGGMIANGKLYTQYLIDARYSFNVLAETGKCFELYKPVYIAVDLQSDGSVKFVTTAVSSALKAPLTQDLPTTDDGHLYIFLGYPYYNDTYPYRIDIQPNQHPIYYYKNGQIREYVGIHQHSWSDVQSKPFDMLGDGLYVTTGVNKYLNVAISESDSGLMINSDVDNGLAIDQDWLGEFVGSSLSKYVPKKANTGFYPYIGSAGQSGSNLAFKISFPLTSVSSSGTFQFAISFDIVMSDPYSGISGTMHLKYHMRKQNGTWTIMQSGIKNGILTASYSSQSSPARPVVKALATAPYDLYVRPSSGSTYGRYVSLAVQNLCATWNAPDINWSSTTVTSVASIPSTATTTIKYTDVLAVLEDHETRIATLESQVCLIEGTQISLFDGTTKNIEDIKTGDAILSYDPTTGQQVEAMALKLVPTGIAKDYDVLIYENGNYAEMYKEHSVFDVNLGYPHSHVEWKVGDTGSMADGTTSKLAKKTIARHAVTKKRYVLVTSSGLYYANGILMGLWPSTKYNILSTEAFGIGLPDEILNEFKREGELNDRSNLLEVNPTFISRSKTIQSTIHRLSEEIEECKKNLTDTDYIVTKFTEGLISAADWLKSKTSRATWRQKINDDEGPLEKARQQLEALKAEIKGDNPSLAQIYAESVTKANEMLPILKQWLAERSKTEEFEVTIE